MVPKELFEDSLGLGPSGPDGVIRGFAETLVHMDVLVLFEVSLGLCSKSSRWLLGTLVFVVPLMLLDYVYTMLLKLTS